MRRALLLVPALAACYAWAPPQGWADVPVEARRAPPRASVMREVPPPEAEPEPLDEPRGAEASPSRGGEGDEPPALGEVSEERLRVVEVARQYVGHRFAGDCSAFVRRVMREAGVDLGPLPSARSMSESLHLASRDVEIPRPGDLIFFHDTYDRNRDGRLGDRWTHVALVEAVEGSRVWILHRGGTGIVRLLMDRTRPHDERANDPVRVHTPHDPPGTRYLTGELFAAYGAVVE